MAFAVLAGMLRGQAPDPVAVRALVDSADQASSAESMAHALARCRRVLVVGSGVDYATARELALKLEEGARLPATAHQLETIRHGHLAAADADTGLVLVLTDGEGRGSVRGGAGHGRAPLSGRAGHAGGEHRGGRSRR